MTNQETIKALRDALQFFIDRCDSGMAVSKTTYAKFKEVLALTADASVDAPDVRTAVERRLPLIWDDANIEWGDAVGGPPVHLIFGNRVLSAVLDEIGLAVAPTLICGTCKADRLKEPCKGRGAQSCPFTGVASVGGAALVSAARPAPVAAMPAPAGRTIFGKMLDDFSELPVLWGLGEPGALVRHGDVFRLIVDAGKSAAPAAPIAEVKPAGWIVEASHDTDFTNDPELAAYWTRKGRNVEPLYRRGQQADAVDGEAG